MYWTDIIIDSDIYTYEYFLQKDVCRLCWGKNADTKLFDENTENCSENSIVDMVKNCLDIDLLNMNPDKVCESCDKELKRFYSYKKFCQQSNQKLQYIIEKGLNEANNKILEINEIKDEVMDDNNFDYDDYLDDATIEFEKRTTDKLMTHSKFRKKYSFKRSPFYCKICCVDLKSKDELWSHNCEFHGIENAGSLFKCFGCEKRFKTKKRRLSHEVNFCKSLKDGYKCNLCERYLPKRSMYEYHMRDHRHNTVTELPEHLFKCKKCVKLFKSMELVNNHMHEEHEEQKRFVCDTCGRVFTRQDYLYKHKLTHTGIKRHQCPHCDFRATQRSSLTTHLRKHTGERPYSCDMCPQRCISSSNLRAHRRRHLGVKKYECNICNKKFGYKISLEEHISSTHVRSETHPCEHCGATYTRIRGLRRHLAAKHAKQKDKEQNYLEQATEESSNKIQILKDVEYNLKENENVLLLKNHDGDVFIV